MDRGYLTIHMVIDTRASFTLQLTFSYFGLKASTNIGQTGGKWVASWPKQVGGRVNSGSGLTGC